MKIVSQFTRAEEATDGNSRAGLDELDGGAYT